MTVQQHAEQIADLRVEVASNKAESLGAAKEGARIGAIVVGCIGTTAVVIQVVVALVFH